MEDIIDPRLGNEFEPTEMKRVMLTASMCIHHIAAMRPDMTRVWYLIFLTSHVHINIDPTQNKFLVQLHRDYVSV